MIMLPKSEDSDEKRSPKTKEEALLASSLKGLTEKQYNALVDIFNAVIDAAKAMGRTAIDVVRSLHVSLHTAMASKSDTLPPQIERKMIKAKEIAALIANMADLLAHTCEPPKHEVV